MVIQMTNLHGRLKLKKIIMSASLLLLFAACGHTATLESGYEKDYAALRSRFELIRSENQIDAFIEELDRIVKLYPDGEQNKELMVIREYVMQVKEGLILRLFIDKVNTMDEKDIDSPNDVFVEVSGPILGKRQTPTIEDDNNPTFDYSFEFLWTINCKPFLFNINDDDMTSFERIGTVAIPCGGITGWKRLSGTYKAAPDAVLEIHVSNVPVCPW